MMMMIIVMMIVNSTMCYMQTQVMYDVWDVWYDDNDLILWYIQWWVWYKYSK
jgi:hypothetical protein